MIRVLTRLSMMASTGFTSNGYQKVYAAAGFPTWAKKAPIPLNLVKITLSGFHNQTGASVTVVHFASPCEIIDDGNTHVCHGELSRAVIPGIGEGLSTARVDGSIDHFHMTVVVNTDI